MCLPFANLVDKTKKILKRIFVDLNYVGILYCTKVKLYKKQILCLSYF